MRDYMFICPKCGGHYWGSEISGCRIVLKHCHTAGCRFTWGPADDIKYFYAPWAWWVMSYINALKAWIYASPSRAQLVVGLAFAVLCVGVGIVMLVTP